LHAKLELFITCKVTIAHGLSEGAATMPAYTAYKCWPEHGHLATTTNTLVHVTKIFISSSNRRTTCFDYVHSLPIIPD